MVHLCTVLLGINKKMEAKLFSTCYMFKFSSIQALIYSNFSCTQLVINVKVHLYSTCTDFSQPVLSTCEKAVPLCLGLEQYFRNLEICQSSAVSSVCNKSRSAIPNLSYVWFRCINMYVWLYLNKQVFKDLSQKRHFSLSTSWAIVIKTLAQSDKMQYLWLWACHAWPKTNERMINRVMTLWLEPILCCPRSGYISCCAWYGRNISG